MNLSDKKSAAKRLIELRPSQKWILSDKDSREMSYVRIPARLNDLREVCPATLMTQKRSEAEFIVHSANHAAQLAEDFLECLTALEDQPCGQKQNIGVKCRPGQEIKCSRCATLEKLGAK